MSSAIACFCYFYGFNCLLGLDVLFGAYTFISFNYFSSFESFISIFFEMKWTSLNRSFYVIFGSCFLIAFMIFDLYLFHCGFPFKFLSCFLNEIVFGWNFYGYLLQFFLGFFDLVFLIYFEF